MYKISNNALLLVGALGLLSLSIFGGCRPEGASRVDTPPPETHPRKLVCLGGDWTIGVGLAAEQAYPALLAAELGEAVRVVNAGIAGESIAGAAERVDWILQQRLHILLLAYGLEDVKNGVPPADQLRAWERTLSSIRRADPALNVVILDTGIGHRGRRFPPPLLELMEGYEARVMGFALPRPEERPELWGDDGYSLSAEGQRLLAERLLEHLSL